MRNIKQYAPQTVNSHLVHATREYLKERDSDGPYLFVSRQSEKLTPSRINIAIQLLKR